MSMQLTAKLIQILPVQSGTGKNGSWQKQSIIVETLDQYHNKICLTIWDDQIKVHNLKVGSQYTIEYFIQSKEYDERWYTNVIATKLQTEINSIYEYEVSNDLCKEIYNYFKEVKARAETFKEKIETFRLVIDKFYDKFKSETGVIFDGTILSEVIDYIESNEYTETEKSVIQSKNESISKINDAIPGKYDIERNETVTEKQKIEISITEKDTLSGRGRLKDIKLRPLTQSGEVHDDNREFL